MTSPIPARPEGHARPSASSSRVGRLGRIGRVALLLALALVVTLLVATLAGSPSAREEPARALAALFGVSDDPRASTLRELVLLKLWRALTAAGVGAALGLAGALLQGLFQNALASPSVLGITTGASLGASVAIVCASGVALDRALHGEFGALAIVVVPFGAFAGAAAVGALVQRLATSHGRLSIPTLLLVGLALNTFLGGALSLLQMLTLSHWDVAKSILTWSNGTLIDRRETHALAVWVLLAPCLWIAPRVGWELDLLQSGEDDARALGVDTGRVRRLALLASTLATAAAVSVAGQIAFVGLIVPHLVRMCGVRSYRALPTLSALAGALVLVAADTAQLVFLDDVIAPGVLMSVVGGPFFVWLLWRRREELALW